MHQVGAGAAQGLAGAVGGGAEVDRLVPRERQRGAQRGGGAQVRIAPLAAGVDRRGPGADLHRAGAGDEAHGGGGGPKPQDQAGEQDGKRAQHGGSLEHEHARRQSAGGGGIFVAAAGESLT